MPKCAETLKNSKRMCDISHLVSYPKEVLLLFSCKFHWPHAYGLALLVTHALCCLISLRFNGFILQHIDKNTVGWSKCMIFVSHLDGKKCVASVNLDLACIQPHSNYEN